jgi:hypothetical protein
MHTALSHWLRLLWGRSPALHFDAPAPFIADGAIHLPPHADWHAHRAAAAHAAAHLVYSPVRFEAAGVVPIGRALWGLLEDARVEALAARELPGLWRLWRPQHTATPDDGAGCEPLMRRLARALADPGYADPHPWVQKGRHLFYLDAVQDVMALHTPADLRTAAMRLGHDIGQMRLPFNARNYRPAPDYRDDHRWMWPAENLQQVASPPPVGPGEAREDQPPSHVPAATRHPEWDRLISRLRRDWATVIEWPVPHEPANAADDPWLAHVGQRLRRPLRPLAVAPSPPRRSAQGEHFDLEALVHWRVAQRRRVAGDGRVYRERHRQTGRAVVWLLIDHSSSSASAHTHGRSVLEATARSAAALAAALQRLGVGCVVAGFQSNGRHAVRLAIVKPLEAPADAAMLARLNALRPGGSTRLGAALRHATARLLATRQGARWVLLLSDGQPHDIDVHDPRYLVEDARHAVREAARRSVRMACLNFGEPIETESRRIFERGRSRPVGDLETLPAALQGLLV